MVAERRPLWWPAAALAALLASAGGILLAARSQHQHQQGLLPASSISRLLRSEAFAAAHEATYLHLRAVLDVGTLHGVEARLFGRLDARSAPTVLTYRDGEPWEPPTPVVDEASARLALASGATVVVNSAQGADSELAALAASTTEALGIYADVNLYATPASSAGLTAHHDHMDSLIVQAAGRKRWLLCEPLGAGRTLPTRSTDVPGHPLYNRYGLSDLLAGGACRNLTMEAGDLLYLPRGTPHAPVTEAGNGSVHLTVGLLGDFIWEDYLKGLTIVAPQYLEQQQLPTVIECFDRRALNKLVPHDALRIAQLKAAATSSSGSGSSGSGSGSGSGSAVERADAEQALGETLFAGFTELAASCVAEGDVGQLLASLVEECGVQCSAEVGRLMLRLQRGEAERRAAEQEELWGRGGAS